MPIPDWVGNALQDWTSQAAITTGPIFRAINKAGRIPPHGFTPKVIWEVVKPHDLRRTCARLCHLAGGELEQIQFLLGHASVQTTERYLGCKQRLRNGVNDHIGIEPESGND
ncbi:MAG: tyrosine-type recombinase/integrase [Acidobacteriaceae bacterium]|nr:tyrosine-type recombinase/integrase [Acidobacteriaceae bacterium]